MIDKIKFSVLTSIYQKENPDYLKEALDSVFAQTFLPSEIVLVEDGPLTPDLYSIIDYYKSTYPIFKIIKNKENLGLGRSLAKGISACSNEYILRMDTDDIIPTQRFEKELQKLEEGYDVVSCWSMMFEGTVDNVIAVKCRPEKQEDIEKLAHKRSPMCHAACAYRKSEVLRAGNYVHNLYYEDYDLWVRMLLQGSKFTNIPEVLYYVRVNMNSIGRRGGFAYLMNEIRAFKRFKDLGFYTWKDVILNSFSRMFVRLLPEKWRSSAMKFIWNHKSI